MGQRSISRKVTSKKRANERTKFIITFSEIFWIKNSKK